MYDVREVLRPARVLIVVPPFAQIDRPALGVHLLQAIARRQGVEVQVLYASMLFAAYVGAPMYNVLSSTSYHLFIGERMFSRAAFGTPPMGHDNGDAIDRLFHDRITDPSFPASAKKMLDLEARIDGFLDSFVPAITGEYDVVGCTSSFEQNTASIAILTAIKRAAPTTLTIMGGANCEGEMAEGLAAVAPAVDVFFDGESEQTFADLLATLARGERPARVLRGTPCADLDALPTPDYADYYTQLAAFLPASPWRPHLNYETSRGCWWGQKNHCTFCGLNGQGMTLREKSPDRTLDELRELLARHPNRDVTMTDNIMPYSYWKTVVPRLATELPGLSVMYEQKANLTLRQVTDLVRAGIHKIQPGIEALSTPLLRHMDKGTSCAQNIALLRYARAHRMTVFWNLLSGFPSDRLDWYVETLELLPMLRHLPPPHTRSDIVIDRFSPYHEHPERYGIRALRPTAPYAQWLPEHAPIDKIAYHFTGEFDSESLAHPEVMREIDRELDTWNLQWTDEPSVLEVRATGTGYQLVDTRGLVPGPDVERISEAQAIVALVNRSLSAPEREADAWARSRKLVVERDHKLVALAVAEPALLATFEERFKRSELAVVRA